MVATADREPLSLSPPGYDALPLPLTSFVGRAWEVAAVGALLRRDEVRLITLTGPGGVGKTRLALRVVDDVVPRFPDGIWFVPLAAVRDPAFIAPAIARALHLREPSPETMLQQVCEYLATRRALLILDNVEHLQGAGDLAACLLETCPRLTVLATSRASLRISFEHEFPVPLLGLPDPGARAVAEIAGTPAVDLFVARARSARPAFALTDANAADVNAICHCLDGLPLAIELAAARVRHLAPSAIRAQLAGLMGRAPLELLTGGPRDAPDRHHTVRDTIAWSYRLLTPGEQDVFRRLSVFAAGFTLAAAEAVGGGQESGDGGQGGEGGDAARRPGGEGAGEDATLRPQSSGLSPSFSVLDGLASLVDKSLLRAEVGDDPEPRYSMLDVIREFGLEALAESGQEAEAYRRHAAWYAAFAEAAYAVTSFQSVTPAWVRRLTAEYENCMRALEWFAATGANDRLLQMAGALAPIWVVLTRRREGNQWLERALAAGGPGPAAYRARATFGLGRLLDLQGNHARARPWLEESLRLYQDLDDRFGATCSLLRLGTQAVNQGFNDRARDLIGRARDHALAMGNHYLLAVSAYEQGRLAFDGGHLREAASCFDEARALSDTLNDPWITAKCLNYLGLVATLRGDLGAAARRYRESLDLWQEIRVQAGLVDWLAGVATLLAAAGQGEQAVRHFATVEVLAETLSHAIQLPERTAFERGQERARATLTAEVQEAARRAGRASAPETAIREARAWLAAPDLPEPERGGDGGEPSSLTARELEVLRLLVAGRSDREIGEALFISARTASKHVGNILAKLDVGSRSEAAADAVRRRLV